MSMLNDQCICMNCTKKEKAHPRYEEARQADAAAHLAGVTHYPGLLSDENLDK